ncbi:MAG: DUF3794 domain-containing protein [Eubacteriales bacterium]|nr:DUF3794 domain-containing protein [Eubacteriales bacterium]MDD3881520.1 DUF3794 domain-containing protein [Eubacteriales bacterium]MDD4512998.1 DUF3794 domain-containing protein [Eubacteriales bacterium]
MLSDERYTDLEELVAREQSRVSVEGEVALPGGLREEVRVLMTDADCALIFSEAQSGYVGVKGRALFHVLYTQGEPKHPKCIETSVDFSQQIEAKLCESGMSAESDAQVESVEASVYGGRLRLSAVILLTADVTRQYAALTVTADGNERGLECRYDKVTMTRVVGGGSKEETLRDVFPISEDIPVSETLYGKGTVTVQDVAGGEGRSMVSGNIEIYAYHASEDNEAPVILTRHTMPYSTAVELSGRQGDEMIAQAHLMDLAVMSAVDKDAGRLLRVEATLIVRVKVLSHQTENYLRDAYTTEGDPIAARQSAYPVISVNEDVIAEERFKAVIKTGENVRNALAASITPKSVNPSPQQGRCVVSGEMDSETVYTTMNDELHTAKQALPYQIIMRCDIPKDTPVMLEISEIEAAPVSGDRIELKCLVKMRAHSVETNIMNAVSSAEIAAHEEQSGIYLYRPQKNETAWDIAKKYRVTEGELSRANIGAFENGIPECVTVFKRKAL